MSGAALHIIGNEPPRPTPNPTTPEQEIKNVEIAKVQATLKAARERKATLVQLAEAYDISERLKLGVTMIELRKHIVNLVQPEPEIVVVARSPIFNIIIGVIAGFVVHMLVSARSHKAPAAPEPEAQ